MSAWVRAARVLGRSAAMVMAFRRVWKIWRAVEMLPWARTVDARWTRFLLAFTIGLLGFLGVEALLEGTELAGQSPETLGGAALVWLGAAGAYLALAGVDGWLRARRETLPEHAAFLVALGAALVVGFALHNTTEGLAIVAPVARSGTARPRTLVLLGLLAGGPAVLGAWVGASAFHPSLAALMFGIGAGAIARVIVQIAPLVRARDEQLLSPLTAGGLLVGLAAMYLTGLLVSV